MSTRFVSKMVAVAGVVAAMMLSGTPAQSSDPVTESDHTIFGAGRAVVTNEEGFLPPGMCFLFGFLISFLLLPRLLRFRCDNRFVAFSRVWFVFLALHQQRSFLQPLLIPRRLLPAFVGLAGADQVDVGAEVFAVWSSPVAGAVRPQSEVLGRELFGRCPF